MNHSLKSLCRRGDAIYFDLAPKKKSYEGLLEVSAKKQVVKLTRNWNKDDFMLVDINKDGGIGISMEEAKGGDSTNPDLPPKRDVGWN